MGTCCISAFKNQTGSRGGFFRLVCVDLILISELGVMDMGIGELHSDGQRRTVKNAGIRPQRAHRTRAEARDKQNAAKTTNPY
jgi:hypothetical protein